MLTAEVILELRRLGKTFPGVQALAEVDFELRRGEVHVLLGENGAGKSTLAKILSGAYQRSTGAIFLDGQRTEIKNPRHARDLGIGMIYQELNLVPSLSVAENLGLGREPTVVPGVIDAAALAASARRWLGELGVSIGVERRVRDLSLAQQQMVEVAKCLSLEARILIMDEPTSALTYQEIGELFAAIRRLKARGVAMIYISHRLEELLEIGDRVTVLRDGRSVVTRPIAGVRVGELIRWMVNRDLAEQYPRQRTRPGAELLRVEGLSQGSYLRDISFTLRRGEVLGVAGLLGSGRSRLARALFGAERVDGGTIYFEGRPQRIASPRRAIDLGIGLLAEDRRTQGLVLKLSVRANICLASQDRFCRWGVVRARPERQAAQAHLEQLRIKSPSLEQPVMFLSGGNQQKVVLSKWLCAEAALFIFDEPTRGIDVGAKVEIYELMNRLTARGAGILMISSDLPEVLGMSDRILTMCRGRITGELSGAEATQEAVLQRALGMDPTSPGGAIPGGRGCGWESDAATSGEGRSAGAATGAGATGIMPPASAGNDL
ncbi:MAG: sugar ABC transporter ATP-binding protein [Verrucomicrobia bacterium]|nr:sugar ABC transporter ATP-binding protein [Verrucomicrobiota bacterium]